MFQNVLVGVDGSPNGRDAVALATRLMDTGGRLTLVNAHAGKLHPLHAVSPGALDEERERSHKLLEEERGRAGMQAELMSIAGGSPGAVLHSEAEEQGADLIVVGSSSRGAMRRVMLGDDTRQALNGAPCAVAIASRGYAEDPKPFASVGVGYNDTPESRAALEMALTIAAPTHARVHALEVVAIPTYAYGGGMVSPAMGEGLDIVIEEAARRMSELPGVEGQAVYGLTGEELAAFGDEVDILVVGSRGYGPWQRLVLGSTSDFLERHARCSLLVLPRGVAGGGEQGAADGAEAA